MKANSNAKAQFSKYKTSLWKASANPGNRLGILRVDGGLWDTAARKWIRPTFKR